MTTEPYDQDQDPDSEIVVDDLERWCRVVDDLERWCGVCAPVPRRLGPIRWGLALAWTALQLERLADRLEGWAHD